MRTGNGRRGRAARDRARGGVAETPKPPARERRLKAAAQRRAAFSRQHSTIFTASPPREVSLYFVFMSAPVSRIVLITESSDT